MVLTNPDAGKGDIRKYEDYLNGMPDDRWSDHVKVITLNDFITLFRVEQEINVKIDSLLNTIEDCLDFNHINKQDKAIEELYELCEKAKGFLKLPLSQQTLKRFLNL